jgi:DNA repair photolyase
MVSGLFTGVAGAETGAHTLVSCRSALNVTVRRTLTASLNPYRGCAHRCLYCYVRAEKYSRGGSPAEFFERIRVKRNLIDRLAVQLAALCERHPRGTVYLGSATDPYQPVESEFRLARRALELLLARSSYRVHVFTKSPLVLDDAALMARHADRVAVSVSVLTSRESVRRLFEQRTTGAAERIELIGRLVRAGVNAGAGVMPVLPLITDRGELLNELFEGLRSVGARHAWWGFLTLRHNVSAGIRLSQRELFLRVLDAHFTGLRREYERLYRDGFEPDCGYVRTVNAKMHRIAAEFGFDGSGPRYGAPDERPVPRQLFLDI